MATAAPSERARVRRAPSRADYDRATIDAILDEALVAHLGFAVDGQPYVIPTLHARRGDEVYVHGSAASRMVKTLGAGIAACLTVTLIDGLVLARSAFHHSMNYRSVVVLGEARMVEGTEEREAALEAFTERLVPGRWGEVRPPSQPGTQGHARARALCRRGLGQGPRRRAGGRQGGLRLRRMGRHRAAAPASGRDRAHPLLRSDVPLSPSVAAWVDGAA